MRIVVTDEGHVWNYDTPILKKYKDAVIVVYLSGTKWSDEYDCVVCPRNFYAGLGNPRYGTGDPLYAEVDLIISQLLEKISYQEDVIFLTDDDLWSLYPFHVVSRKRNSFRIHLYAMSPCPWERFFKREIFNRLMEDLTEVKSALYIDSKDMVDTFQRTCERGTIPEFLNYIEKYNEDILPRMIREITKMDDGRFYFDLNTKSYVRLEEGFDGIDLTLKGEESLPEDFYVGPEGRLMGMPSCLPEYPLPEDDVKEYVERPVPVVDGKRICNVLRKQRIRIAGANGIPFNSEDCPSVGPCAGTCPKCDLEEKELMEKMSRIPENKRVYPQFDPVEEMIKA